MDCLPHLHIAAIHSEAGYRSDVPGLGVMCRDGLALLGAGRFSNSIGGSSSYAAAGYQKVFGAWRLGFIAGVIDGYERDVVQPLGAMIVSRDIGFGDANLMAIPHIPGKTPSVVQLSLTFRVQ